MREIADTRNAVTGPETVEADGILRRGESTTGSRGSPQPATDKTGSGNNGESNEETSYCGVDPPIVRDRPQRQRRMPEYLQEYEVGLPSLRA